jgi:hypothetical protein
MVYRRTNCASKSGHRRIRLRKPFRRMIPVALGIAIFFMLNTASFMNVHKIEMNLSPDLDPVQMENLFLTKDLVGMNVLWLPYRHIKESMESHPLISEASVVSWPLGTLKISLTSEKPTTVIARPWGYYVIGEDGRFIRTIPPFYKVSGFPIKFSAENVLFDDMGRSIERPWEDVLSQKKISDRELMLALGYRDLLILRENLLNQKGIPEIKYLGYDERLGLMLKCKGKPIILIGYGDDLMIHYTRAIKVLTDPSLPFKEKDKYIDIRFDEYQSAVDIAKLQDSSPSGNLAK